MEVDGEERKEEKPDGRDDDDDKLVKQVSNARTSSISLSLEMGKKE